MKTKTFNTLILSILLAAPTVLHAQTPTAQEILKDTKAAYQTLKSYSSTVKIKSSAVFGEDWESDVVEGFLQLLRPNFYHVRWNTVPADPVNSGVAWNSGSGDFLYNNGHYFKAVSLESNLGMGEGLSRDLTSVVPSLFFAAKGERLGKLKNLELIGDEAVGNQDCFVLQGSDDLEATKVWIAKDSHLVLKFYAKFKPQGQQPIPQLSDQAMKKAVTGMGQDPTPENIAALRKMLQGSVDTMNHTHVELELSHMYENIKLNDPIEQASLEYQMPPGAVLKHPFDGIKAVYGNPKENGQQPVEESGKNSENIQTGPK